MKKVLLLTATVVMLATPLTAAAQTAPVSQSGSSCLMVDSENPSNWMRIDPGRSWEAQLDGKTYRSSAFDSFGPDPADPTRIEFADATGVTVDGAPAPASLEIVGRFFDGRDKAKIVFKLADGLDDATIVDQTAGVDSHAFDCSAVAF